MLNFRISRFHLVSLLIVAAAALPLLAGTNPVGRMNAAPTFVEWQITADNERIQLNVSAPDGSVWSREFPAGRNPVYRLQESGNRSMDGTYQYELVVVPRISSAVRKELAAARAAGDDSLAASIMARNGLNQTVVQSGAFTILNGSILSPDLVEPEHGPGVAAVSSTESSGAAASSGGLRDNGVTSTARRPVKPLDQVIADDLIVQGSACVGLDCVNNESFGFDTIRMKENNDRVKFEDTSTSTGFPSTDWQLTANDSASGGANKFSIEDITSSKVPFTVTGGAATNSIFVDSTGRLGLRTSTPVLDIHTTTGNTPALRFEQNATGGFTAQTWDVAGNEANFFVRDVTGGSRLPFRIRPGAPTSSIDISAAGNVGIGTASPTAKLDVIGGLKVSNGNTIQSPTTTGTNALFLGTAVDVAFSGLGNNVVLANASANALLLGTSNLERLRIDSAGSVGIGTSAPSSRLHVNGGDIRVSGGSFIDDGVTLNAPDYVFDPSYKLMPISELASFVRNEKHLPNVPQAAAIKAQGLNLSQFSMRLLEKVEELTLYTVAQNDEISMLKTQNAKLLERLEALEQKLNPSQKQSPAPIAIPQRPPSGGRSFFRISASQNHRRGNRERESTSCTRSGSSARASCGTEE